MNAKLVLSCNIGSCRRQIRRHILLFKETTSTTCVVTSDNPSSLKHDISAKVSFLCSQEANLSMSSKLF